MQNINYEYRIWKKGFATKPKRIHEVKIGHTVFVNTSPSIVTQIENNMFKAISLVTKREGFFDKQTGYGIFNLHIRALLE